MRGDIHQMFRRWFLHAMPDVIHVLAFVGLATMLGAIPANACFTLLILINAERDILRVFATILNCNNPKFNSFVLFQLTSILLRSLIQKEI